MQYIQNIVTSVCNLYEIINEMLYIVSFVLYLWNLECILYFQHVLIWIYLNQVANNYMGVTVIVLDSLGFYLC